MLQVVVLTNQSATFKFLNDNNSKLIAKLKSRAAAKVPFS